MKCSSFSLLAPGLAALLLVGCAGAQKPKHEHRGGPMSMVCPMPVPGTTVAAADIEGGAALTFITTGDVNELRLRIRRMAELNNEHPPRHRDGDLRPNPGGEPADMHEQMPDTTATAEDLENGAQLTLVPKNPADLTLLRDHLRQHADKINRGDCPPLQMK